MNENKSKVAQLLRQVGQERLVIADEERKEEVEMSGQMHFPPLLSEVRAVGASREEMGYDAPFSLFTWAQWLEMQAKVLHSMSRFQRAIEHRDIQTAFLITLEIQEVCSTLQKEVYSWLGLPLQQEE